MRVCYVVNSRGDDIYADLAYVSARFLRALHPQAHITCLTDRESGAVITSQRHPILSMTDRVMEIDVPQTDPNLKNRWIKTNLRRLVDGDLLYVDSDTLFVRKIDDMWEDLKRRSIDAAIARDLNIRFVAKSRRIGMQEFWPELRKLGWQCPRSGYFNCGVMFFGDTPGARRLGEKWHQLWRVSSQLGRHYDQPAFNQAIVESSPRLHALDPVYNAMILAKPRMVGSARIMHLFTSVSGAFEGTVFREFVEEIRRTGALSDETIESFLADPFPWNSRDSFRRYCWAKDWPSALWILARRFVLQGK
jgi:hypothetical protein